MVNNKLVDRYYYGLLKSECGYRDISLDEVKIYGCDIQLIRDDLFPQTGGV